jgi:hypothetical protein
VVSQDAVPQEHLAQQTAATGQQASKTQVKNFARQMITDHGKAD